MAKRQLYKALLLSSLVLPTAFPVVNAQELVLNYDGFFNRIKKSKKADYENTKLGIFLKNAQTGRNCQINDASIRLDNTITPVTVGADYELMLPYEQKLRDDKAKLFISVEDQASCDLSFQIMTADNEVNAYQTQDILKQIEEFDLFLGDMAGYFGRMKLPVTIGIQLIFDKDTPVYTSSGEFFKQGTQVSISQDEIIEQQIRGIQFERQPLRVIPLTEM